jgi:hypothetical protein
MGFVLKARQHVGRTHTFGLPVRAASDIRKDIENVLQHSASKRRKQARPVLEQFPVKRLRSNLADAMCCSVVFQRIAGVFRDRKSKKQEFQNNPIWDLAPSGAYYKAKRLCSLLHACVSNGKPPIERELTRLAINIWRMSKRAFDGLCRRVRSKIARYRLAVDNSEISPDAVLGFVALSTNPVLRNGVNWYSRYQEYGTCRFRHEAMLRSSRLETAQLGLYLRYKRALPADRSSQRD